ncbi:MAG TPA: patatin-like phospholipase family protein [Acidimicrobiia bacterium]|nr:patatin-like phospholipase family protein [Acidimicrobiia bacterium]
MTAFVLSGGGNQGVAQVGMLRALLEQGHQPDVVVGTSVGALNGAVVAGGPGLDRIAHLEEVWTGLRGEEVFPGKALRMAWNVLRRGDHLFPNDGLRALIEDVHAGTMFEDLTVPLRVVATDLGTGEEVVIARGPVGPALLASAALPGIFPPVDFQGQTLVDGAVVNLVPISHALAGPVDRVFVLDVSDPIGERPIRSPLDVAVRAFAISRDQRFELELQWVPKEIEVVVLPPPADERDFFDFSGGDRLIAEAYDLTMGALDELREHPGDQRRRRWWRRLGG